MANLCWWTTWTRSWRRRSALFWKPPTGCGWFHTGRHGHTKRCCSPDDMCWGCRTWLTRRGMVRWSEIFWAVFVLIFWGGWVGLLCAVHDCIYAPGKAHLLSTMSLRRFPSIAFETVPVFVWLTVAFSSFQGRLSSASSFHAFLLQAINSVVYLALCLQVLYQPPQHFRSSETQATCDGYFACQSICLSFPFTLACPGQCSGCQPLTHSSMVFTFHS